MSVNDRFRPPAAVVADADPQATPSDAVRLALAVATLLQLLLFFIGKPARVCLELLDIGALHPLGGVSLAAGFACLYVGMIRLVGRHRRGARLLAWSVALQILTLALWHRTFLAPWGLYAFATFLVPYAFGLVLAAWACFVARSHAPARTAPAAAGKSAS